jgi:hypothetical protein
MRAEARREFEFVHEMLPLNEAVDQLVAQIPLSAEESISQPAGVTADTPVITQEPVQESAPVEPAIAEADQVLSQFTQQAAELAAQEPVVSAEPPIQETSPALEALSPEPSTPAETSDPFGLSPPSESPAQETFAAQGQPPPLSESGARIEEAFSAYADQKRGELFGLENSVSLDEYLSQGGQVAPEPVSFAEETPPVAASEKPPAQETPPEDPFAALTDYADTAEPPTQIESTAAPSGSFEDPFAQLSQSDAVPGGPKDQIEEIAEKLKEARRITPVINLSDRSSATPSEADTPSETGFDTPTLAEIYAKQGWYDDAIKAYKTLAVSKPSDREKYENRIRELEELKKQQAGT